MRLINSITLQLEFISDWIPDYVILSHTWGEEEVSFQDIQGPDVDKMKGHIKLQNFCAQAARDCFDYAWMDTCCIDKCSSAELSEAINSMYKWYNLAKICYAYLENVTVSSNTSDLQILELLRPRRWFTRGWTLQELIAPSQVEFYGKTWNNIGSKRSLRNTLCDITGIDIHVLGGEEPIFQNFVDCIRLIAVTPSNLNTMPYEDVCKICQGYPVYGIETVAPLASKAKSFRFIYVSGAKAERDQTKKAWVLREYGLMRGKTESMILSHAAASNKAIEAWVAKPGLINVPGQDSYTASIGKAILCAVVDLPKVDVSQMAACLINQAVEGFEKETLPNGDLVRIGETALAGPENETS
ncbi:hypothetical protein G7Y89_g9630 [Cudoniella acicularis]|uniref:Heterokaryon incompatibility domain-containing protein n=1 Tax=Cudoniella acicularis TaxID=354080 RepID=A0A8H4VZY1_9HELO|nr:hypothetical protein G7Y89_g9630 [Cudoniella acicularis]